MNIELGTGVTKSKSGATKASKALRVVGVMGKALAYVELDFMIAALERHWMAHLRRIMVLKSAVRSLCCGALSTLRSIQERQFNTFSVQCCKVVRLRSRWLRFIYLDTCLPRVEAR